MTLKFLKMQKLKIIISVVLCLISLNTLGQGVAKAYETTTYQGKVNGRLVSFNLANGYIGASSLKMYLPGKTKPLVFEPDGGVADGHSRLKFVAVNRSIIDYFILNNMQEAYDEMPAFIDGGYFLNNKKVTVKFGLVRAHKH